MLLKLELINPDGCLQYHQTSGNSAVKLRFATENGNFSEVINLKVKLLCGPRTVPSVYVPSHPAVDEP